MLRWVLEKPGMRDWNLRPLLGLDKAAQCGPALAKLAEVLQKTVHKKIAGEVCAHRNLQVRSCHVVSHPVEVVRGRLSTAVRGCKLRR